MLKIEQPNTILLLGLFVILFGCQQLRNQKENQHNDVEEVTEEAEPEVILEEVLVNSLTAKDSIFLNSLIQELKGIDKFFVKDSYKRLQALLKIKENQNALKVNEIIEKVSTNEPDYYLEKYVPSEGYLAYVPGPVEVFVDMVYWNMSDGSKLIATQSKACGPVCDDLKLTFEKYQNGFYKQQTNIIPNQMMMSEKLVPGSTTDDSEPYEFYFKLPIAGKELQYCIGEDCLTLEWNDGVFTLKE